LEALIASERILRWMTALRSPSNGAAAKLHVLRELTEAIVGSAAYREQAQEEHLPQLLTSMLGKECHEELLEALSRALTAITRYEDSSGDGGLTCRKVDLGAGYSVNFKEGPLGDGLGAKVWDSAFNLCKCMLYEKTQAAFEGRRVLEIGAGVGICGLLAAQLGSTQVVLTDFLVPVLELLQSNADAQPVDGCDIKVCHLDWENEILLDATTEDEKAAIRQRLFAAKKQDIEHRGVVLDSSSGDEATSSSCEFDSDLERGEGDKWKHHLGKCERFEIILASDVLYEWPHSVMLPLVLKRRLAADGWACIANAMRDRRMFEALVANLRLQFEHVEVQEVPEQWRASGMGIVSEEATRRWYDGGYMLIHIRNSA